VRIRKHRRFSKRLVVGKGRIRSVAADYEERRCVIRFKVTRLRGVAEALGRGAHLLVAFPEPADEQRLRAVVRYQRSVCLRGDGSTHGAAVGPLMKLFGQFLEEIFSETNA
jgi:hypothetical protein